MQKRLSCFKNPHHNGLVGDLAISWMKKYFSLHAEVMPTIGRFHLIDNDNLITGEIGKDRGSLEMRFETRRKEAEIILLIEIMPTF